MSAHDVTAAVERAARAIYEAAAMEAYHDPEQTLDEGDWPEWDVEDPFFGDLLRDARHALAAALDVEEMARVMHREGAWCGVCEYDGWDACKECRETVTGYAAALRAAILGGAA